MTIGVYRIKSKTSGYFYVGSSRNVQGRIESHFKGLSKGSHHNIFFQRVFDKYGEEDFECLFKETKNLKEARCLEQYYLDKYAGQKKFMNIGRHATGGDNITKHPDYELICATISKSLRKQISEMTAYERQKRFAHFGEANGMYGKTHTPKVRRKLSKQMVGNAKALGTVWSDSSKRKMSESAKQRALSSDYVNPFKGKTHSKQTRAILSKAAKERIAAGSLPSNTRRVKIGRKVYRSLSEAAREIGVVAATVLNRIRSENYPAYKYLD